MQTLEPVNFVHNKVLTFRKRKSENFKETEKKRYKTDSKKVGSDGSILDKNVQTYRMWFLFLKLALELEHQNATLIVKMGSEKGSKRKPAVVKKISVNKKIYKDWHPSQVMELHFNDWWKTHSHLFVDEGVRKLTSEDEIRNEEGYLYVRINTQRRIRDINKSIRSLISKENFSHKSQARFPVTGNPRPLMLQNRYNALLLKLEDKLSDKQILDPKNKYLRSSDGRITNGYTAEHKSRTMFGLISGKMGAKEILLNVCEGYFLKKSSKAD